MNNHFYSRTRFKVTLIGFVVLCALAILKHFYYGISETIVGLAAGIITSYIAGETFRPSGQYKPKDEEKHE